MIVTASGRYPLRTILNATQAASASSMHIIATVPGVRYMFAIIADSVHLAGSVGLFGSNKTACVRIGMMQKISAAVIRESMPSFHHILLLL